MATARRTRVVAAAPQRVWELLEDPHHMPRWWPGVARMEGVEEDRFTQVMVTKKGRPVRLDFRSVEEIRLGMPELHKVEPCPLDLPVLR